MRTSPVTSIRRFTFRAAISGVVVCVLGLAISTAPEARPLAAAGDDITLTGCLIRGEGDGAGYLLANAPGDPAWLKSDDRKVEPSSVGTTGSFTTIFYWLEGSEDLRAHIGHRVQVEGDLVGDVKEGEIKTDRKDRWTEVTVSADGRKMKARVPHASVFPGTGRDQDRKTDVLVRRVLVEHVKMQSAACLP